MYICILWYEIKCFFLYTANNLKPLVLFIPPLNPPLPHTPHPHTLLVHLPHPPILSILRHHTAFPHTFQNGLNLWCFQQSHFHLRISKVVMTSLTGLIQKLLTVETEPVKPVCLVLMALLRTAHLVGARERTRKSIKMVYHVDN